jgi:flavin reductase (DIM6/NTAB) family NADH-FMN oxidoreductase RutF
MNTNEITVSARFQDLYTALSSNGAFLVAQDGQGKPNIMTIGWATLGFIWQQPIMTVYVRPSRYTYGLIENARSFSVNVPVKKLARELGVCGSRSGRDTDKAAACGFTMEQGKEKGISIIQQCDLFYECVTVSTNDLIKERIDPEIVKKFYPSDDFHRVYFGRVLHAYEKNGI